MRYEDVIDSIGGFGSYQFLAFNLLASTSLKTGFDFAALILNTAPVKFLCNDHGLYNNASMANDLFQQMNGSMRGTNECFAPLRNVSNIFFHEDIKKTERNLVSCTQWVYDKSEFQSSPVMQYNLICDQMTWPATIQFLYLLGSVVAYIFLGPIGDKLGRRKLIIILAMLDVLSTTLIVFMPTVYGYAAMRFFTSMHLTLDMVGLVLVQEIVPVKHRDGTGILIWIYWVIGYSGMAGLGYVIRDWKTLQLVSLSPCLLYIPIFIYIVESPRWLTLIGRSSEAQKELKKIADFNKVALTEADIAFVQVEQVARENFTAICQGKNTLIKTFVSLYSMVSCGIIYWGISMDASFALDNIYLNCFALGIIEAPAYIFSWYVCSRLGRRWMVCGGGMLTGILVLIVSHIPKVGFYFWLRTSVALFGKLFATATFAAIILYVAELFPTSSRTVGAFVGHSASSIGSTIAPYLNLVGLSIYFLPSLIFGILSLSSSVFIYIYLPETRGASLPQTFAEAEAFVRGKEHLMKYDAAKKEDTLLNETEHTV